MKTSPSALLGSAFLAASSIPRSTHAAFLDELNNTANLIAINTGSSITTLDDNAGSGSVLLERDDTETDTFVDWRVSQTGYFSIATESLFILTPEASGANNLGTYNVNLLFFSPIQVVMLEKDQ